MRSAVRIPVTVKCRIGADDADSYSELAHFVSVVSEGGCDTFIVHARKCLLHGLSPKDNRNIPPLRYHWVQRLALDFPTLKFGINGGITTIDLAESLLCLRRSPVLPLSVLDSGGASSMADDALIDAESAASRAAERGWKRASRPAKAKVLTAPTAAEEGATGGTGDEDEADSSAASANDAASRAVVDAAAGPESPELLALPHGGVGCAGTSSAAAAATSVAADAAAAGDPSPSYRIYTRCRPGPPAPGCYGRGGESVLDSVMVGRAAYNNAWLLADVDRRFFGVPNPGLSRRLVVQRYVDYCEALAAGTGVPPDERGLALYRPFEMLKPLIGLFHGEPGGGRFRATLAHDCQARKLPLRECVDNALACLPDAVLDALPPAD
jgi:hypothetical protein